MQAPRLVRRRDREAVCPLDFWPGGRLRDGPQWSQERRPGGGLEPAISLCILALGGRGLHPPPCCRAARAIPASMPNALAWAWRARRFRPWPPGSAPNARRGPAGPRPPRPGSAPPGTAACAPSPRTGGQRPPASCPSWALHALQFGLGREQPKAARDAPRPRGVHDVDVRIRELIHAPPSDAPQSPLPMVVDPEAILRKLVFRAGTSAKGARLVHGEPAPPRTACGCLVRQGIRSQIWHA